MSLIYKILKGHIVCRIVGTAEFTKYFRYMSQILKRFLNKFISYQVDLNELNVERFFFLWCNKSRTTGGYLFLN